MGEAVSSTSQPSQYFVIEGLDVVVGTVVKKVLLYVFYHVLHFSFTLWICLAAKVKIKTLCPGIPPEGLGQNNIPSVLAYHKDLVLVIYDLFGDTTYISEGFFVGQDGRFRGEVPVGEPGIFKTGTRQYHRKEEDLCPGAGGGPHVVFPEIHLCLFTVGGLLELLELSFCLDQGQPVFLSDPGYKIEDRLLGYYRKIGTMFLKPVVHLGRRGIPEFLKTLSDKIFKGKQFLPATGLPQ